MKYVQSLVNILVGVLGCSIVIVMLFSGCQAKLEDGEFTSSWHESVGRVWIGPEYWANRLQDWQVSNGRIECMEGWESKPMRTVHLLTRRLSARQEEFTMQVRSGLIVATDVSPEAATGFLVGAGANLDYRGAALVHHTGGEDGGIAFLMEASGRAVALDMSSKEPVLLQAGKASSMMLENVVLELNAVPAGDLFNLTFEVKSNRGKLLSSVSIGNVPGTKLIGNVALVSHPGKGSSTGRFWFKDWKVAGDKFNSYYDRLCGPVISTQYTLSRNVMKMTAQLMPVSLTNLKEVTLQVQKNGTWETIATTRVIVPGFTATFRIGNWDSNIDTPYRVLYPLKDADGKEVGYMWSGTVRRDPVDKETIVVAGFTGNHNVAHPGVERGIPWTTDGIWFPHNDITDHVAAQNPDLLFFSGDNVYEGNSPTQAVKSPLPKAMYDYLYKWYLWCWAYRDLAKDIPCITIPDDHDVYQGNVWGAGGRKTDVDNKGGYVMDAEWVKMVERTQTSHLPDPFDPRPIDQGIGVYYCDMVYGRIGFAVLEDRKFKSGPNGMVPETGGRPDHVTDPDFDVKTADVPEAKLLGDRQLAFLKIWAANWDGVDMKAALSQTIFAGMATHHGANLMYLIADYDSNGWPQSGRNRALHELRRGYAFMIGGDQHLSTIVHHGVDDFDDAGWSFCVPSIANFYPRAWNPSQEPIDREPEMPDYTGKYLDGLGNHVTVWAATNPGPKTGQRPALLHDNMPGYGIVKFEKEDRKITMECWPRYVDPKDPSTGTMYEGWPKTIPMEDNYGREAAAYLPTLEISGMTNPVVQVLDQTQGEIVYTIRIKGTTCKPKIFNTESLYTVKVGEPSAKKMRMLRDVKALAPGEDKSIALKF